MRNFSCGALVVTLSIGLSACGGDGPTGNPPDIGDPEIIAAAAGDDQRIIVGAELLQPLVVKVSDDDGDGVPGESVTWEVTGGGGSLSATSTTTNSSGEASVMLTVGGAEGDNTVTASVDGLSGSPITFTAKGVVPTSLQLVSGDGQDGRLSQPLALAFVARVRAADGGVVPGATVDWSVDASDGSLSATSSKADEDGEAATTLTLGSAPETNTVSASVTGIAPVTFDAEATTPVSVTVRMDNIAFNAPGGGQDVTIMLGDTVKWVNDESVQHTATSSSMPSGGSSFDSGLMNQGEMFSFVPNRRGDWVYFCEVHPVQMRDAVITVE